ncbi:ABC transporter substrate-binding protein [Streptomyces zhihengii]
MRSNPRTPRRIAATAAAALAVALTATACGGSTTPASGGELSGKTVTVAGVWTGSEQKNFKKVLDAFTEKTGAKTVFVPSGDNVSTFVGSKIEGGNAPDVVMVPQVGVLQQFAQEGWLTPLSDTAAKTAADGVAPVWKEYGTVDGAYYGLYFKAAHKSTVWYSPDAFTQAGVGEPGTYEEMLETGRTLADSGRPAFAIAGEDGWTLTDWFENIYLSQAGPEKYDQLAKHELKWTDESVVTALTTLGEVFKDKQLVAGGAQGALRTDFPASVEQVFGPEPKAGMVYEGDFVGGVAKDEFGRKPGEDAKFFPFPPVGGGEVRAGTGRGAATPVLLADGVPRRPGRTGVPGGGTNWAVLDGLPCQWHQRPLLGAREAVKAGFRTCGRACRGGPLRAVAQLPSTGKRVRVGPSRQSRILSVFASFDAPGTVRARHRPGGRPAGQDRPPGRKTAASAAG